MMETLITHKYFKTRFDQNYDYTNLLFITNYVHANNTYNILSYPMIDIMETTLRCGMHVLL